MCDSSQLRDRPCCSGPMHCMQAVWGPVAPYFAPTALCLDDNCCFSGAADGSIACWQQEASAEASNEAAAGQSLQPTVLLHKHMHPVVAVLAGLIDSKQASSSSSSFMLSLDSEGWLCLWDVTIWVCLDMQRAVPLPPGTTPTLLLMPDQKHVCIIIPAYPTEHQQQQHGWRQQLSGDDSSQQQLPHPAAAAAAAMHAPMMLVLRWRSLALIAAPLVGLLGPVVQTSSNSTAAAAAAAGSGAVVAAVALETAPALAPIAADTVVLAVTSSGYMFAGSTAGNRLPQAWQQPLAVAGSTAPLLLGCLRACSSSSNNLAPDNSSPGSFGSSTAANLQLQLLVVQHSSWRLFVCCSFSSSSGMPQHWQEVACQQYNAADLERSCLPTPLHANIVRMRHGVKHDTAAVANRVRFCGMNGPDSPMPNSSDSDCSADKEVLIQDSDCDYTAMSKFSSLKGRQSPTQSIQLQKCRHPEQQTGIACHLLGGLLLSHVPGQHMGNATDGSRLHAGSSIAVMVWADSGLHQVWVVQVGSSAKPAPGAYYGSQQLREGAIQLLHSLQLQPPTSLMQQNGSHCLAHVLAAFDQQHNTYALLMQQQQQPPAAMCWLGQSPPAHQQLWSSSQSYDCLLHQFRVACSNERCSSHKECKACLYAPDSSQLHDGQRNKWQHQWQGGSALHACSRWQLQHMCGSWAAAWSRQHLYHSSSITDSSSSIGRTQQDVEMQTAAQLAIMDVSHHSSRASMEEALPATNGDFASITISAASASSLQPAACAAASDKRSSTKRPAALMVSDLAATDALACRACGPRRSAAAAEARGSTADSWRQPSGLHHKGAERTNDTGIRLPACGSVPQQQQVTHMLLLGSDVPSLYQLAVILESGVVLFYDLASYCVPGAAWHPDICIVGTGHMGRVTTVVELAFKCPPFYLIDAISSSSIDAAAASERESPFFVKAHPHTLSSAHTDQPQQDHQQQGHQQSAADNPYTISCRPAAGGSVPLLLTGGVDGSVRAWDLRSSYLGGAWAALHPHTAPVEAIVLPPVSARLPWSTCVLSCAADGSVAMSCLATGTTQRIFTDWPHGAPAQLAWSTSRGLLAAGGWDASSQWQVMVWDTYSGHLDRALAGPPAHMLMAALSQELTSSIRHTKRGQQQQQQHEAKWSLTAAVAATAATVGADVSSKAGAQFVPRLQVVTHDAGPIRALKSPRPDALLFNINIQQLTLDLEAHARQQQQLRRRQNKQQLQQQQQGGRGSSIDDESSSVSTGATLSRPNSLDMSSWASEVMGSWPTTPKTPGVSAFSSTDPFTAGTGTAAAEAHAASGNVQMSDQISSSVQGHSNIANIKENGIAASKQQRQQCAQQQQQSLHQRSQLPAAVLCALQALCVLHRWGCHSGVDKGLVQLLQDAGRFAGWPKAGLLDHSTADTVVTAMGSNAAFAAHSSTADAATNISSQASTSTPQNQAPFWRRMIAEGAGSLADYDSEQQLLLMLRSVVEDPPCIADTLLSQCPCFSHEVLLSPNGACTVSLPTSKNSNVGIQQQQQTEQQQRRQQGAHVAAAGDTTQVSYKSHQPQPVGVLLGAVPSLLSSRLLSIVAICKWLMANMAAQAAPNACNALVTMYALRLPDTVTTLSQAAVGKAVAGAIVAGISSTPFRQTHKSLSGATAAATIAGAQLGSNQLQSPFVSSAQQQQQGAVPVVPDLLLIASVSLAGSVLLQEAAQLLLAALLHPAAPGTFNVPCLTQVQTQQQTPSFGPSAGQQQQQQEVVFASPGSAAAASRWPPAVLQMALLHHQHLQQQQQQQSQSVTRQQHQAQQYVLSLKQLPQWLPHLVLSAAAAAAHPAEVPPELAAGVAAGLLDVLLEAAPAAASCAAAAWLCQVLRSGHWSLWRPYIGKPVYLLHRLCYLVERLQQCHLDARGSTNALINQALSPTAADTANAANGFTLLLEANQVSAPPAVLLMAEQPYATESPVTKLPSGSGSSLYTSLDHHIEGGLYISSALLHPPSSRASSPAAAARPSASASASMQSNHVSGSHVNPLCSATPAAIGLQPQAEQPPQRASGMYTSSQQQQQCAVHFSRSELVSWLRGVVDLMAALMLVDPAGVLNELSHKLSEPASDSSSSLPLVVAGLSRLLRHSSERCVLLPHLGITCALAAQAMDPSRPLLRQNMLQPVTAAIRELVSAFPQVACHGPTLQLAVGSTRAFVRDVSSSDGAAGGDRAGSTTAGRAVEVLQAVAVAVFDLSGGPKKKLLLLPVLLGSHPQQQQQQRQQHPLPAGSKDVVYTSAESSNSNSIATGSDSPTQLAELPALLPGGSVGLWSRAEGAGDAGQAAGVFEANSIDGGSGNASNAVAAAQVYGGSTSSSLEAHGQIQQQQEEEKQQQATQHNGLMQAGSVTTQRSMLASNTITRAETAMVQHWFGAADKLQGNGSSSSLTAGTARAGNADSRAGISSLSSDDSGAVRAQGVWQLHAAKSPLYTSLFNHQPTMTAADVVSCVSAVAINPAGDAVAALIEACYCVVVWRMQSSWTQKLVKLGSSRPVTHYPAAYIPVPPESTMSGQNTAANAAAAAATTGARHHSSSDTAGVAGMTSTRDGSACVSHSSRSANAGRSPAAAAAAGPEAHLWQLAWHSTHAIDVIYKGSLHTVLSVSL